MNILSTVIVALAFLLVGFLWGREKAKLQSLKDTQKALGFSRAIIKGKVSENIVPLLPDFEKQFPALNLADARFIGEPIDYLFFEGMNGKNITKVLFLEVKSGKIRQLNDNENSLKRVIQDAENRGANIGWREYNVPELFQNITGLTLQRFANRLHVDSRIAFALPFFKTEILAIVMPTFSASSVTLIFRFANMTSMLMMIAIVVTRLSRSRTLYPRRFVKSVQTSPPR
jgi:hypothetical protein